MVDVDASALFDLFFQQLTSFLNWRYTVYGFSFKLADLFLAAVLLIVVFRFFSTLTGFKLFEGGDHDGRY